MSCYCCILLGGLWGFDGHATSAGMYDLQRKLNMLAGVTTAVYAWSKWYEAWQVFRTVPADKKALIGYSGGGSRGTWFANQQPHVTIDLLVTYDPSPSWQMQPIGGNVLKAVTYHNNTPRMLGLGGGVLVGSQVEVVEIAEQHMSVQFDQALHARTLAEVQQLIRI